MKQEPDLLKALTLSVLFLCAQSDCDFTSGLVGRTMVSEELGAVFFKSKTTVVLKDGFVECVGDCPVGPVTFHCEEVRGYEVEFFLRSEKFALSNDTSNAKYQVTMCWFMHRVKDVLWTYFQGPKECSPIFNAHVNPAPNAGAETTCNLAPLPLRPYKLWDQYVSVTTTMTMTSAVVTTAEPTTPFDIAQHIGKSGSPKTSTLSVCLGMTLAVLALAATHGAAF